MNTYTKNTPSITDGAVRLFSWMKSCNFFKPFCNKRSKSVKSINRAIMKQEDIVIIDGVDTSNEHSKKIAAYALNLCTVSVSQIVDYNDIHVLEQEYEAILNNLNLENIPKDEALLRTLKQILDTITFFRIQEGDKKMLQKSYEQKVKNAIWNAVPNFGMIVGGSPITMVLSLASMVGMGYMNYRREKAKINLENEQQLWQLQRSALEQFNALRRELFDAAWRLADKYNFPDNYRLTEKQISQYDEILMDPISLRRFHRLWTVRDSFEAFPPFWYYLGSAANSVYLEYKDTKPVVADNFKKEAKEAFEHYLQIHDLDLLRVDQIRTSCDLEYADILFEEFKKMQDEGIHQEAKLKKEKTLKLVEDAYKHSGRATDVLQLCAIKFIQLEQFDRAQDVLLELVVENSNASTNAYLLNTIYLRQVRQNEELYADYQQKYYVLQESVPRVTLLPWPAKTELSLPVDAKTVKQKQDEIYDNIETVMMVLACQHELMLKKAILFIPPFTQYSDNIYSSDESEERAKIFNDYVAEDAHLREYLQLLHGEPIHLRVYNKTEDFVNDLISFYEQVVITSCYENDNCKADEARKMIIDKIPDKFTTMLSKLDKDILTHIENNINNNNEHFSIDYYKKMDGIDVWEWLLESCINELDSIIQEDIDACEEITILTEMSEKLETFCINRGIEPHQRKSIRPTIEQGDPQLIKKFNVEDSKNVIAHDKQITEIIKRHQSLIQKNEGAVVSFHVDNIKNKDEIIKAANGDYILANITLNGKTILCFTRTGIIARIWGWILNSDWIKIKYTNIIPYNGSIFVGKDRKDRLLLCDDDNLNKDIVRVCADIKERFK